MKRIFLRVIGALSGVLLLAAGGAASAATPASAANYPDRAIKMIVAFPPAGATDIMARSIGQELAKELGQSIVVENRPGAGGNIGAGVAAQADPDGYTLFFAALTNHAIAASVYHNLKYDIIKSFAPISLVGNVPHILVVTPSLPVKSVKDLIALAKAQPGKFNAASQGNGTLSHLELEMFKAAAGIDLVHVPYKGSSNAMPDLLSGQVSLLFDSIPSSLPHIQAGRLRALGVLTLKRLAFMPDVPTIAESGLPGFEADNWFAVMAPAGTPRPIVDKLNAAIAKVLLVPELRKHLAEQGAILQGSTPEELATITKNDVAKWAKVVKDANAYIR